MPSPAPTPTDRAPAHREAAARVVDEIAARLRDPARVAATAAAPDNVMRYPGDPQPVWNPLSLSDGHPGVALLFAELADAGPAHAHLSAALAAGLRLHPQFLFTGMTALAYAGHTAAQAYGGYAAMLTGLDRHITDQAHRRARADRDRVSAGQPVDAWAAYDVLTGTTGIGRYLLARHESAPETEPALRAVLESLVATASADDVPRDGVRVPAWWITDGLDHGLAEHVNLGCAHGVSGPLALLALAWRAGVRVDRHDEAIERIMALLTRWRTIDAFGPRWPHLVTRADLQGGELPERGRDSWCYGTAGTARAVHLAGTALDRAEWRADAETALRGALDAADDALITDSALCHGWAGLLHITQRTVPALADGLAAKVIDGFTPEAPFGYRYHHALAARPLDRPGLLEGASGIALALHAYATGTAPATSWDGALLLA